LPFLEALPLNFNIQFSVESSHRVSGLGKASHEKPDSIEASSFGPFILSEQEHAASALMKVFFFHLLHSFDVPVEGLSEEPGPDSFDNSLGSIFLDSAAVHRVSPPSDSVLKLSPLHPLEHFGHASVLAAVFDLDLICEILLLL
jgi:hypothetical protein